MTESIFKNTTMTSYRQSWTSVLVETKIDYDETLVRSRFRVQSPQSKEGIEFFVRRQLPCPVGDNYLDRLTDM